MPKKATKKVVITRKYSPERKDVKVAKKVSYDYPSVEQKAKKDKGGKLSFVDGPKKK